MEVREKRKYKEIKRKGAKFKGAADGFGEGGMGEGLVVRTGVYKVAVGRVMPMLGVLEMGSSSSAPFLSL